MDDQTTDGGTANVTSRSSGDRTVRDPPESYRGILQYIGPSLAVAAITIGSGELIATTALGARVGIVILWFLIISLIVKVAIQYQFSKYGLIANKTPHEIFDEMPGKIYGHSLVWWWMAFFWTIGVNIIYMGVFFGAGTMLYYILGQTIPLWLTLLIVLGMTIFPALRGYDFVENYATAIVVFLSIITIVAAALTFRTPYSLSTEQIAYGLSFHLPPEGIVTVLGTIGTTGIAANELIGYASYVQETGYGKYAGSHDSDEWLNRMQGWLGVMRVDILLSVTVTVVVTVAFFIIGTTVVSGVGNYPDGPQLVVFLANIYENLFGPIGYWLLLIGGFFALYSTAFGEAQLVATVWPDWVHQTQWGNRYSSDQISKFAAVAMPIVWYIGGYISNLITPLIILGGVILTLTYIPEIITTIWTLRQERDEPKQLRTKGVVAMGVWIGIAASSLIVVGLLILQIL